MSSFSYNKNLIIDEMRKKEIIKNKEIFILEPTSKQICSIFYFWTNLFSATKFIEF